MSLQNEKEKVPFFCSWVVIIILLILVWPLGAMLAWRRGKYSRKTGLNLGIYSMILGVIFMAGAIIAGFALGDDFMRMCAVYAIAGVVFARMGYEGYKKSNIYKQIIFEVEEEGILMVPMLADEIGMPEVDVIKHLITMTEKKFLPYHELAHNNKKLVKK